MLRLYFDAMESGSPLAHADTARSTFGRNRVFDVAREVAYSPIAGQSLVDLTVKRLKTAVSLGMIEIGEQLPSEPGLAERLGVSPATLREALAGLRAAGVVETKRGRGGGSMFVREALPPPVEEARAHLAAFSFDDLRDLGEYYTAISGRAAALAAERATPTEADLLRSLVGAMFESRELCTIGRLDAQFHIGLASAARSTRLTAAETSVQAELAEFVSLVAMPLTRLRVAQSQHEQIIDAVCARDMRRSCEAAEWHAQTVTSLLLELRSEVAIAERQHADGVFVGLQPYGAELGSTPLELAYEPIWAARRGPAPSPLNSTRPR
jgi:DNA-binding FadR family transcriptional regulator